MQKVVIGIVLLLSQIQLMAQGMHADWAARWENARLYTLAVAEAMPEEDYGFKPLDSISMSFGEQLLHLGHNARWLSQNKLAGRPRPGKPSVDPLDKAAVIEYVDQSFHIADSILASLSFADLEEQVEWFAGPLSKRRIGLLIFDHATHHRAQAIMYLRLKSIEPPRYVGW